jgi:uncharacterized protein DUF2442
MTVETLPQVVKAEYQRAFVIRITFNDGTEGSVDFEDWLEGPIFQPLLDQTFFRRFFIESGALTWPNGADIAPETLYERAKSSVAA